MSVIRLSTEQVQRCLHGVGYEIFVQSFFDSNEDGIGDLNGLRQKLDYLSDLGITLIWLMPIHPAKTYHKYDVEDYMTIHSDYGTIDDFRQLINECHQRNILVILDFVVNHTSYDHPWFRQAQINSTNSFRDYYIWIDSERVKKLGLIAFDIPEKNIAGLWHKVGPESEHFDWEKFEKKSKINIDINKSSTTSINTYYAIFDPRMPDLNYDCERVHDEICRIGRTWLELGVDGFRLDAAKYIYKPSHLKSNLSWWTKFRNEMSRINPSVYLIGEVWDLSIRIAPYLRSLDSIFNFELANILISCILNEGNCSLMLNSYIRIINNYIRESNKENILDAIFLSNHDQNRIMSVFNNNLSKGKMAAALLLTLPGLPFIYYGEEIGMLGMTPHDKYRREPFFWSSTNKCGQTTWLESLYTKLSNGCIPLDEQINNPNSLFNHYKKFIHIRSQFDILRFGLLKPFSTRIRCLCLFERIYNNKSIFIAHNIGSKIQKLTIPENFNQIILSTKNENEIMTNRQINLHGYSSIIIQ
jgi:glycosidase